VYHAIEMPYYIVLDLGIIMHHFDAMKASLIPANSDEAPAISKTKLGEGSRRFLQFGYDHKMLHLNNWKQEEKLLSLTI
jgi:hypothetical protein